MIDCWHFPNTQATKSSSSDFPKRAHSKNGSTDLNAMLFLFSCLIVCASLAFGLPVYSPFLEKEHKDFIEKNRDGQFKSSLPELRTEFIAQESVTDWIISLRGI